MEPFGNHREHAAHGAESPGSRATDRMQLKDRKHRTFIMTLYACGLK